MCYITHSLRFTSGAIPANLLAASMAAKRSLPHTCEALVGLKTGIYHATAHSVRSGDTLLTELSWLEFIFSIARTLIKEELRTSRLNTPHVRTENLVQNDFTGDYFPEEIPRKEGTKRKPSRPCFACNGSWSDIKNKILPKCCSRIWCVTCKKVLCATPCFKIFHTHQHYKNILLNLRFPPQVDN